LQQLSEAAHPSVDLAWINRVQAAKSCREIGSSQLPRPHDLALLRRCDLWNGLFPIQPFIDRSAMPTVHPIDEPNTNRATHRGWTDGRFKPSRHARKRQTTVFKEIIMNAKTLFAALSLALAGSVAMASEAAQFEPASTLSRAGVAAI
jgi:hypothetical protein